MNNSCHRETCISDPTYILVKMPENSRSQGLATARWIGKMKMDRSKLATQHGSITVSIRALSSAHELTRLS